MDIRIFLIERKYDLEQEIENINCKEENYTLMDGYKIIDNQSKIELIEELLETFFHV